MYDLPQVQNENMFRMKMEIDIKFVGLTIMTGVIFFAGLAALFFIGDYAEKTFIDYENQCQETCQTYNLTSKPINQVSECWCYDPYPVMVEDYENNGWLFLPIFAIIGIVVASILYYQPYLIQS